MMRSKLPSSENQNSLIFLSGFVYIVDVTFVFLVDSLYLYKCLEMLYFALSPQ